MTEHQYGAPSSSSPIQQHTAPRLLHLPMADRSAMTSTPTSYRRQLLHHRQRRLLPHLLPSPSTARTAHECQPSDALVPLADDSARPAATPLDLARADPHLRQRPRPELPNPSLGPCPEPASVDKPSPSISRCTPKIPLIQCLHRLRPHPDPPVTMLHRHPSAHHARSSQQQIRDDARRSR
ncbi:hypothetical protein ACLOJK_017902 [Asimina triloba]